MPNDEDLFLKLLQSIFFIVGTKKGWLVVVNHQITPLNSERLFNIFQLSLFYLTVIYSHSWQISDKQTNIKILVFSQEAYPP